MFKDIKISGYQLAMLMMGFIFGSSAVMNPAASAGQDVWLAGLFGLGGGVMLMLLYTKISLLNPSLTLIEILQTAFGKYLGNLLSLLYIGYFIHLAALVLRDFGEHMAVTVYYTTPLVFTMGSFALLASYCLKKGLEVSARAAEMLMPYLFIFLTVIFFLLIPEYNTENFFPVLEKGFSPILKAAFNILTFPYGETVVFLMIFPALYSAKRLRKVSLLSVLIMGLILLSVTVRDLLSLGPDLLTRLVFPPSLSTELTQEIQLEPLISVNLLLGGWIKITICMYGAVVGIAQLLKLDDYKPFVLPLAILCVAMAIWLFPDVFEMLDWATAVYPYYAVPIQIIIPVLILIITNFKKNTKKRDSGK